MKKILASLVVLGVLAAGGLFLGRHVLFNFLTPEVLVEKMESAWNCRAEIQDVDVTLAGTAKVEITGLALGERDETVEQGVPLADRAPLAGAIVRSESVVLEVRPAALFRKRLDVQQLILNGLHVQTVIERDGESSLERLFQSVKDGGAPETEEPAVAASPMVTQKVEKESRLVQLAVVEESGDEKSFNAAAMPFVTVADNVQIRSGTLIAMIEASGTHMIFEEVQLGVTRIDVDPGNLAEHNEATFRIDSNLVVSGAGNNEDFLRARISGNGVVHPFDVSTGEVDPVWNAEVMLHKGAAMNTFPILEKLREKLDKIDTAGVDLSDINIRGELQNDAVTRVSQSRGKYTFDMPLELRLPETDLLVHEGSWLDTGPNTHEIRGAVVASEALTAQIQKKVDHYLEKKAKNFASESMRDLVMSPVMQNGKIVLEVVSQGDMGRPKVDVVTAFGNLTDVIKNSKDSLKVLEEAGKSLLKGLFGQ